MRKKICLLIFLVLLLLGALLFTDGSYRPFVKLTAQDIASVTIQLGDEEARCLHSAGSLREAVRVSQRSSSSSLTSVKRQRAGTVAVPSFRAKVAG